MPATAGILLLQTIIFVTILLPAGPDEALKDVSCVDKPKYQDLIIQSRQGYFL